MVEIKLAQGAKPGKGGVLPKEKITAEIAAIRGIPMERTAIPPTASRNSMMRHLSSISSSGSASLRANLLA